VSFDWIRSIEQRELDLILSIPGSTDSDEVSLLYELARQATAGCIVEVGSAKGRSTAALALGAKRGSGAAVYAIEPHEPFQGVLGGMFTTEQPGDLSPEYAPGGHSGDRSARQSEFRGGRPRVAGSGRTGLHRRRSSPSKG
jgi:hypothetical protein